MKTIGNTIKEARVKKRYSLAKLEKETKIKKEFIEAIEKDNWKDLPEYPVLQGFVKRIASTLKKDPKKIVALLRRDYPPKKLNINPKPYISERFSWSPKLTFLLGILIVSVLIMGYLGFQYFKFISPPSLEVSNPKENQKVEELSVLVSGKADVQAVVKVNNQPILVDEYGNFSAEIEIVEDTKEIVIKAISRSGKEAVIRRNIITDLGN